MAYLTAFDSRQLRTVLGTFTTGVTIVTTHDTAGTDLAGTDYGVTANSFSSVSLEPPLVLWSLALTSRSFPAFRDNDHFAVNILADDQIDIANRFAKSTDSKFADLPFTRGLGEVPVLAHTVAHFECVKVAAYPAGDHTIFLGRVERVGHSGRRPLAYAHGRYMVPYAHELGPLALQTSAAPFASTAAVARAADALPAISAALDGVPLTLSVWGNHGPTIIRCHQGANALAEHSRTGLVQSTTHSAAGIAFAAFLPGAITEAFIHEDLRLFRVADEDEQEQRRAFDEQVATAHLSGIVSAQNSIAAPVHDRAGNMIFALSAVAKPSQLPLDANNQIPQALLRAAKDLTASM